MNFQQKYITPPFLNIFTWKFHASFFNKYSKQPKKVVNIFIHLIRKIIEFSRFFAFQVGMIPKLQNMIYLKNKYNEQILVKIVHTLIDFMSLRHVKSFVDFGKVKEIQNISKDIRIFEKYFSLSLFFHLVSCFLSIISILLRNLQFRNL